jgi:HKD family nuclease
MSLGIIEQPHGEVRLGSFLQESFANPAWEEFRAAIAFVKYSGAKHVKKELAAFSLRARVRISVGIDAGGTSVEGLSALLEAVGDKGDIWVYHNAGNSTFHPKVYLFKNATTAELVVGSGNLTEGGLFTNYEASLRVCLDLHADEHAALLAEVETMLDRWCGAQEGICYRLDAELLKLVAEREIVLTEAQSREVEEGRAGRAKVEAEAAIFKRVSVPAAPVVPRDKASADIPEDVLAADEVEVAPPEPAAPQEGHYTVFLMTLQQTDVGRGQTTEGTSQRSPEIFIPLAARDADPEFWGWPGLFTEDHSKPGKMDRTTVKMRVGASIVDVNMMTWPDKHDFRLRSENIRSAGNVGDILRMERADGTGGFTYYVEVIPQNTVQHGTNLALCVNTVRNSVRRWGYI